MCVGHARGEPLLAIPHLCGFIIKIANLGQSHPLIRNYEDALHWSFIIWMTNCRTNNEDRSWRHLETNTLETAYVGWKCPRRSRRSNRYPEWTMRTAAAAAERQIAHGLYFMTKSREPWILFLIISLWNVDQKIMLLRRHWFIQFLCLKVGVIRVIHWRIRGIHLLFWGHNNTFQVQVIL